MKRKITTILLAMLLVVGTAIGLCACANQEDIDNAVLPVEQQVTLINTTLDDMKATDKTLKDSIDGLTTRVTALETELVNVNTKITALETNSATKEQLETVQTSLQNQINSLNTEITALKAKDEELQGKITALQNSLTSEINYVKSWATDTFLFIENWNSAKKEIDDTISALTTRVCTVETEITVINTAISALQEQVDQNTQDIEIIKNCLNGEHVYDESRTTYVWNMEPTSETPVTCTANITCKYCEHSYPKTLKQVIKSGFIYTARFSKFNDFAYCSDQTFDITDTINMSEEDVKKAVQIMVGDGTSDSVDVKVTLKNENRFYLNVVNDALEKAKDGSVNLTVNGVRQLGYNDIFSFKIKSVTFGNVTTISNKYAFSNPFYLTEITFKQPITECESDAFSVNAEKITLRFAEGQKVLTLDSDTNTYKETDEYFKSGNTFCGETFKKIISAYSFVIDATEMNAEELGTKLDEAIANTANIKVILGANADATMFATINNKLATASVGSINLVLSGVTAIPENAFKDNKALRSITIPKTVTSIASGAFEGCDNLKEVYYEGELADWLKIEFSDAYSSPCVNGAELYFNGTLAESITISGVTSIGLHFIGCTSLKNVTIGDDVTSIGGLAFMSCSSLTSVTLGKNVTSIGEGAFLYCNSLVSVTGGEKVSEIGQMAFYECASLASIDIPEGATVGQNAFYGCKSLRIPVLAELKDGDNADEFFAALKAKIKNYGGGVKLILKGVTAIPENAFSTMAITAIVLPKSVTNIADNAFHCENVKEVYYEGELADWLKIEFGNMASSPCAWGAKLYFNGTLAENITVSGVTKIGSHFAGCTSLKSVVIGNDVTSIEDYAFMSCSSLTSVTLGKNVTSIGEGAFASCSKLESVIFEGTTEEWNAITEGDYWNLGIVATEVVCSDGKVTL